MLAVASCGRNKEGKKMVKAIGPIDIPWEAFLAVLKTVEDEAKKMNGWVRSGCRGGPRVSRRP